MPTTFQNFNSKNIKKFVTLILILFVFDVVAQKPLPDKLLIGPAKEWLDNRGKPINAHGGGVLFYNGIYYWYGEHKIEGKAEADFADGGIHCYTSKDLVNWTDAGLVLSVDYNNQNTDLQYGCLLERPKVVYNSKTRKFIAYFKFYPKGNGYEVAFVGVAISDSPVGPFVYSHKFLAASPKGSGDFSMFIDDNGDLFHLAVRKPDKAFIIAKMRDDYLLPAEEYRECAGIEKHTEAPAIIKNNGTYHLLGSGSSGWKPNVARYYTSKSLYGPWVVQNNPCEGYNKIDSLGIEKTFGAQSSFIIKINGLKNAYVAMFDIWKPDMPITGRYIWLPVTLDRDRISIRWLDNWNLNFFSTVNAIPKN